MPLQLDQLETLIALVDEGSFESAARRLHISPSAVSQRVKAMESTLGGIVVERSTPVRATPVGAIALRYARQIQAISADASLELSVDDGARATVSIAVNSDSLATWFLPALALANRDRGIAFDLHRDDQDHTTDLLRSGTVAAAVTSTRTPVQGCMSTPLGSLRYLPVCTPAFVDRWLEGEATAARLVDAPVVYFDRKDDLQARYLRDALGRAPGAFRHHVPSSREFAESVLLGLGWALLPEQQCSTALAAGELVEIAGGSPIDVELNWQAWNLSSSTLDAVSAAVIATAKSSLRR
ncbi:ArgP/LysG family DNA-binding transcriptional regulator [Amnibacterium flavum]|uniref:ArgP/LysG family DNA-binding transcriptional regulator n=2 Tax=Amnibacterium flavum TaxID=2173173 RepID=A0A2V1HZV9_9MICO|nr:ArgP/LysG family DNA-binding transcriptional regulator [Amnibacterium flavum]